MEGAVLLGSLALATAIYAGLMAIANAILRNKHVEVRFSAPLRIESEKE